MIPTRGNHSLNRWPNHHGKADTKGAAQATLEDALPSYRQRQQVPAGRDFPAFPDGKRCLWS